MIYCCGGASDIGNYRENNEDSIYISSKQQNGVQLCFGLVCDGIGGMRDGEIASGLICERLGRWFEETDSYSGDFEELSNSLLRQIYKVNSTIIERMQVEDIQTGSTLAAVLAAESNFIALNVGDSRIYRISGKVMQISKDDVVLTSEKGNRVRTRLSQCIGNVPNIYVNTVTGVVDRGEAFIICSDGLYKHITDRKLVSAARWSSNDRSCEKGARRLIEYVKKKGERDNISAVILKCKSGRDFAG